MSKAKTNKSSSASGERTTASASTRRKPEAADASQGFPEALAQLLRARKIKVPSGLSQAPPEAYARQPAAFVSELATLSDEMLAARAEKIAGYARRQAERATAEWEGSPLIAEIRRRKLKEPAKPVRVVGASFSLKRPLAEWSDSELVDAATEWSRRASAERS